MTLTPTSWHGYHGNHPLLVWRDGEKCRAAILSIGYRPSQIFQRGVAAGARFVNPDEAAEDAIERYERRE